MTAPLLPTNQEPRRPERSEGPLYFAFVLSLPGQYRKLPPTTQTLLILTLGACGMATLLALLPAAGHDQMWLLYAARLMLHVAPLYGPTIFETNPPLILWLSAIPAALAPILHLPDTTIGKLLVLFLEAAIALLCLEILGKPTLRVPHPFESHPKGRGIEPTARPPFSSPDPDVPSLNQETWASMPTPYVLLFAYITAVAVLPARDFGQRDHLLTLFLLPYLFAAARRLANLPVALPVAYLSGILALLGLALKPHQLLIPLAIEITLLLRVPQVSTVSSSTLGLFPPPLSRLTSLLRPELQSIFATGLLFLLAVHHFAPLYFTSVVPLARDTYWAYGGLTLLQLLAQSIQLHILLLLNLAVLIFSPRPTNPLIRILLTAGLAATLAFHLQGTGWYYQQLPALTFLVLALALRVPHPFESHPKGWVIEPRARPSSPVASQPLPRETRTSKLTPHLPFIATTFTLLTLALTTHFMNYPFTPARSFPIDQPDHNFFAALPPGTPVLTLSPTIDDTLQPIYKFHLTLAQRYPAFLLLPALLRSESGPNQVHRILPTRLLALDHLQHTMMVEDLNRWHPALILVERCQDPTVHCQVLEDRHDDLLAFFLRDPAFAAIFTHYRLLRTSGPYDAYTLTSPF